MHILGCLPVHDMVSVWLGVGAYQFAKGGRFAWDGVFQIIAGVLSFLLEVLDLEGRYAFHLGMGLVESEVV